MLPTILDFARLRGLYASGTLRPVGLAEALADRIAAYPDKAVFITTVARDALVAAARDLETRHPAPNSLPLWGIPFAVKDNIDVAGLPTTAACPAFAYTPAADAAVVARLRAAGALVVGKANLDQFATGLNGTRSPYGAPRSVFSPEHISGGSSSGSAVAVGAGLASFALGTDTAGSGRVPAAFNNLVGIKPTPGRLPTDGLVPACRSLDCVSVFAATVADGIAVRRVAEGGDPSRMAAPAGLPARPRVGVLAEGDREFFGDTEAARLYAQAVDTLAALDAVAIPIDYAPFRETAALLYEGPWVAERLAPIEDFLATHGPDLDPSVRAIIESGRRFSAADAFRGFAALDALKRRIAPTWESVDHLLLPTAPTTYTVAAMMADPIRLNSRLGLYTNFTNLLGLAAIAVPAGFRGDGLPAGVTLIGPGSSDEALAPLAEALHAALGEGLGLERTARIPDPEPGHGADDAIPLAVVGAHLSGLPLNPDLVALGARLMREGRTAPDYRLFALPGTRPPKPGLVRDPGFAGPGLAIEVWALSPASFGRFVADIPAPLGIGKITLDDGTQVPGFLCEAHGVLGAEEVTAYGGWRSYVTR
ncbi:allophanate hydrolase [Methylobacterium sp. JK268]